MFSNGILWWAPLACAALLIGGCGSGDETKRFDVSGSVTLGGAPLPAGQILFEPDASKDNRGPAGFATITNGRYDTAVGGKGTVGGPHVLRISGSEDDGGSRFEDYRTSIDLPKQKATQDIDIPASLRSAVPTPRPGPEYTGP